MASQRATWQAGWRGCEGGLRTAHCAAVTSSANGRQLAAGGCSRGGDSPRITPSEPALRIIMRRLREIMAEPSDGQSRLDKIVRQIAGLMVAEVCSIYLKRQDGSLELFATEGLNPGAVHNTLHEARRGSGRALCRAGRAHQRAGRAEPSGLLLPPGDGRGDLPLVPRRADPARRRRARRAHGAEQDAQGVFRRGRGGAADHRHGARRASGRPAPSPAPTRAPSSAARVGHVVRGQPLSEGLALGHVVLHEPRVVVTELEAKDPERGDRRLESRRRGAEGLYRRDAGAGRACRHRRAPRRARGLPHVRARPRLAAAHEGGDQARHDRRGGGRAGAERHPRAHAAPVRCLLARAAARPR